MFLNDLQSNNEPMINYQPHAHLLSPFQTSISLDLESSENNNVIENISDPNKYDYPAEFINTLRQAINYARKESESGALLIVSISNFAMIMNAYGHDNSEKIMLDIIGILQKEFDTNAFIERINHEQIGIILKSCDKATMANHARKIHSITQDYGAASPIGALHVTCSIGGVDFPAGATDAVDALDKSYIALNSTLGMSYCTYKDTLDESLLYRQQMGLANYLRRAIAENRLRMAYQPVVSSVDGSISHYEALLRIISKDGKISSAGALIPVAERMGLIDMVDHLVFDMVCKELANSPNIHLAFNVSNLTTSNFHWLEYAVNVLKQNPDIARRTIVEITETAAQRDLRRTAYFVSTLQAQGCKVALDDFGSGYTSFRQLKTLSVDIVKIDGAFIKDLTENSDNRFFVKTMLDFAKGFGLTSVAEYIEKGETAKLLMELGVDYMQGYYFGKPENYRSWLNKGEYKKN